MNDLYDLQLFAEANTQTSNDLSAEMKTYYGMELLESAKPQLVHNQFAATKGMPVGVARMPPSTRRLMFPAEPPVRPRWKTERQAPASRFRPVSQSGQVIIVFSLVFLARRARGCAGGLPARPRDPLPGRRERRPGPVTDRLRPVTA